MLSLTNVLIGMVLATIWIAASYTARAGCSSLRIGKPGLSAVMLLTLVAVGGAIASQFAIGMLMGLSLVTVGEPPEASEQARMMLAMPVWMIVCAMVYRYMLPTTFGKAMIIFMAQAAVVGLIVLGLSVLANATQQPNLLEVRQFLMM